MDATVNTLCIVLQPWAGHRRGATVAIPNERAAPLIKRGILELIARVETPATLAETPTESKAIPPETNETRRRGRPPRAK